MNISLCSMFSCLFVWWVTLERRDASAADIFAREENGTHFNVQAPGIMLCCHVQ